MIERFALAGIALLGSIVALPNMPNYIIAQVSTPTPPAVVPAWILGAGHFYGSSPDVDPGATADQHLFAGVLDASATANPSLPPNCPGIGATGNVSSCNPYLYINMLDVLCGSTPLSMDAYVYLNGSATATPDETGFVHEYASGPTATPDPRVSSPGNCPTPNITPTPSSTATAGYYTNPTP